MELSRRCLCIAAVIALCLVATLTSIAGADGLMPGEWDGEWSSACGPSSGMVNSQIYPSVSNLTGAMALTNAPCTDATPLAGTLQQGILTLGVSCNGCSFNFTSSDWQNYPLTGQYNIYCHGRFYDQGTFSLHYSGPWQNPKEFDNGWWYDWIGYFNISYSPWIYHVTIGWLYPFPSSAGDAWFWDPQWDHQGGWLWTSSSVYPWVYSVTEGAWLYYITENATPGVRWFCNSTGCASH